MIEIIASNSDRCPVGIFCTIQTNWKGTPEIFIISRKMFDNDHVEYKSIGVEILDEEKSKSFLGAAGVGLVGAAILGPLGLIAGALSGGHKQTAVFGLTFRLHDQEVKLVVKSSSKQEISFFKERSFVSRVS